MGFVAYEFGRHDPAEQGNQDIYNIRWACSGNLIKAFIYPCEE